MNYKIYLNVSYEKKDIAKSFGAKWDKEQILWYINGFNIKPKIVDFIPTINIIAPLYLIETDICCWKCSNIIPVYAFSSYSYVDLYDLSDICYEYQDEPEFEKIIQKEIWYTLSQKSKKQNIYSDFDIDTDKRISVFMKNYPSYKKGWSATMNSHCYGNYCLRCGVLQGNFFLHNETDSPFCSKNNRCSCGLKKKLIIKDGVIPMNCNLS